MKSVSDSKSALKIIYFLVPEFTQVRFLAQQFAGANLKIQTHAAINDEGKNSLDS